MLRHQFIFHKWGVFKGGLSLNAFHHTQVYPPSSECILYLVTISAEQGKADVWILFSELSNVLAEGRLADEKFTVFL